MPFDPKKAIETLQAYITITDEDSPFEWVGSYGAGTCVIILIQGLNAAKKKVAACAHVSGAELQEPLGYMLQQTGITSLLKAHLVSCLLGEDDREVIQPILANLRARKVLTTYALGVGIDQAAMNVKTGEWTHSVNFSFKNSGFKTKAEAKAHADAFRERCVKRLFNSSVEQQKLQVWMDVRKPEDVAKMIALLDPSMSAFAAVPVFSLPFAAGAVYGAKKDPSSAFGGMRKGFLL